MVDDPKLSSFEKNAFEESEYSFLNFEADAQMDFLPYQCTGQDDKRPFIAIAPRNLITERVAEQFNIWCRSLSLTPLDIRWRETYGYTLSLSVKYFDTLEEIKEYASHPDYEKTSEYTGLCFGMYLQQDGDIDYKVYMVFDDSDSEYKNIPRQSFASVDEYRSKADFTNYLMMVRNGYLFLQNWVANEILRAQVGDPKATIVMGTDVYPEGQLDEDEYSDILNNLLPLFMILMNVVPIYRTTSRIVSEKGSRIRETLRILGLSDFAYWLSWLLYYTVVVSIISLVATLFLCLGVFTHSNFILVFLYIWVYSLCQFGFIVFIS